MISVIVPIYNAEKWLEECISSIVNQTYGDLEILLIDDGSTDSSGAICDKYARDDNRIKVFHIENGGVSNARNIGMANATGEWTMFLDADDWLEPDACEKLLAIAVSNNAEIVSGSFVCEFKSKSTKFQHEIDEGELVKLDSEELVLSILYEEDPDKRKYLGSYFVPWGRLIKTKLLKDSGAKYTLGIHPHEDIIFNIKLFSEVSEHYLFNITVVHYRVVMGSAMHSKKKDYFANTERAYYALKEWLYSQSSIKEEVFTDKLKAFVIDSYLHQDLKYVVPKCNYNLFRLARLLKEKLDRECYVFGIDENVANRIGLHRKTIKYFIRPTTQKRYVLLAFWLIAYELKQKLRGKNEEEDFF